VIAADGSQKCTPLNNLPRMFGNARSCHRFVERNVDVAGIHDPLVGEKRLLR